MKFHLTEKAVLEGAPRICARCPLALVVKELMPDLSPHVSQTALFREEDGRIDLAFSKKVVSADFLHLAFVEPVEMAESLMNEFDEIDLASSKYTRQDFYERWKNQEFELVPEAEIRRRFGL